MEEAGGGAPPADAWQQAWRAIAPQWGQIRAKAKVSVSSLICKIALIFADCKYCSGLGFTEDGSTKKGH